MKKFQKYILITTILLFTLTSICLPIRGLPVKPRGIPDEWIVANSYNIVEGEYWWGDLSDTYYSDGNTLCIRCSGFGVFWLPPWHADVYFYFGGAKAKKVKLDTSVNLDTPYALLTIIIYFTDGSSETHVTVPAGYLDFPITNWQKKVDRIRLYLVIPVGIYWEHLFMIDQIRILAYY